MKSVRNIEIMQQLQYYDWNIIKDWVIKNNYTCLIVHHEKENNDHFHAYIKFNSPLIVSGIVKTLNIQEQYLQKISSWKSALAYAFHLGSTSQEESLTPDCVLFSNNVDIESIFEENKRIENKNIYEQLFFDYGNLKISKKQLFSQIDFEIFNENRSLYDNAYKFRQLKIGKRELKVMYITGASGSGKTTLAKYIADTFNYDYFISASGQDPLGDYDKEECIIFDDLRGDIFKKAELFKLLDNNTNSSVKSRYVNKDISNCKLIVITSVLRPYELYSWGTDNVNETYAQFLRRLSNCFYLINSFNQVEKISCNADGLICCSQNVLDISSILNKIKKSSPDDMSLRFDYLSIKLSNPFFVQSFEDYKKFTLNPEFDDPYFPF